ncbi:hypothetical protein NUSPORA_00187 [Nucleospora cyclopteri]
MVILAKKASQKDIKNQNKISVLKSLITIFFCLLTIRPVKYDYISQFPLFVLIIIFLSSALLLISLEWFQLLYNEKISSAFYLKLYFTIFVFLQIFIFSSAINYQNRFFGVKNSNNMFCLYIISNIYHFLSFITLRYVQIRSSIILNIANAITLIHLISSVFENEGFKTGKKTFLLTTYLAIVQSTYCYVLFNIISIRY